MPGDKVHNDTGNHRQHPRYVERNRVTVTVLGAPSAPELERRSFYCWTHDLSSDGMRFCAHSRVPPGTILKLEVKFVEPLRAFQHIGKVKWAREVNEDGIVSNWLGVHIVETTGGDPDIKAWNARIEGLSAVT